MSDSPEIVFVELPMSQDMGAEEIDVGMAVIDFYEKLTDRDADFFEIAQIKVTGFLSRDKGLVVFGSPAADHSVMLVWALKEVNFTEELTGFQQCGSIPNGEVGGGVIKRAFDQPRLTGSSITLGHHFPDRLVDETLAELDRRIKKYRAARIQAK